MSTTDFVFNSNPTASAIQKMDFQKFFKEVFVMRSPRDTKRAGIWILLAVMLVGTGLNHAQAQMSQATFNLSISEKKMALSYSPYSTDPDDVEMIEYLKHDQPYQRVANRNMPFIELENPISSTLPITEFRMTIGDERFNFSNIDLRKILKNPSFPGFAIILEDAGINNITSMTADGGDELVLQFGNGGISPGELVRFQIDLAVDTGVSGIYPNPDFRTVLFDMNGINPYGGSVNGMSDNAILKVLFGSGSSALTVEKSFDEFLVDAPQSLFYNNLFRPSCMREPIDVFRVIGAVPQVEIPEPGSIVLAMLALVGGLFGLRNRFDQEANCRRHARTY